jgi:hypothetical protein
MFNTLASAFTVDSFAMNFIVRAWLIPFLSQEHPDFIRGPLSNSNQKGLFQNL